MCRLVLATWPSLWINNGVFIHWEADKWKQTCRCIEKKGIYLKVESFDYLGKIDMKNVKTGILMQAEYVVTVEFINIINKNTLTGLCNALLAFCISFPYDILQLPWNGQDTYKTYGCF